MRKESFLVFSTVLAFFSAQNLCFAAIKEDHVKSMPEWPSFSDQSQNGGTQYFSMYSGYLRFQSLYAKDERSIHYVFMESLDQPAENPVVLWLNGGPGCSSMEGLLTEIGPFVLDEGQNNFTQKVNPYTWLNNGSLLFFESPVGRDQLPFYIFSFW